MPNKIKPTDKIKAGLTEMLTATPVEDITATALCEYAKVNRATFYYHYNSVQDVLKEIEAQVELEFAQWLSQSPFDATSAPTSAFYVTFFEFVARNANVCKVLLGKQHNSDFLLRALEAGRSKVIAATTALYPQCPQRKIDYYYTFVSNGFIGLLQYWLNNGMRESVAEIAEIGESVSYLGINYLK